MVIRPIQPHEAAEARRMIHAVAGQMFNPELTAEQAEARYHETWPIRDVLDYETAYHQNGGVFLVAVAGERIVGTGALRRLEGAEDVGEIKRLWLLPEFQGQGIGKALMLRLIDEARERGYTTLRLETSPVEQARAYEFYKRLGFYDIPPYGDDPGDAALELRLDGSARPAG
jgi:putative acetyltransferase